MPPRAAPWFSSGVLASATFGQCDDLEDELARLASDEVRCKPRHRAGRCEGGGAAAAASMPQASEMMTRALDEEARVSAALAERLAQREAEIAGLHDALAAARASPSASDYQQLLSELSGRMIRAETAARHEELARRAADAECARVRSECDSATARAHAQNAELLRREELLVKKVKTSVLSGTDCG
jgi:exonuclease VII large subunit